MADDRSARAPAAWRTLLVILSLCIPSGVLHAADVPMIDAHSQVDEHISLDEILGLMDQAGVARTILAPRGQRRPEELLAFAARHPGRITPAVRTKGGAYLKGPREFERFLARQIQAGQFGAMSEILLWHAEKKGAPAVTRGPGHSGAPPQVIVSPDDARVHLALGAAKRKRWPLVVHIEFAAMGDDRDSFMNRFERLLRGHPDHPFVLMHMGQLDAKEVRRLIENHTNLRFNTAMSNPIATQRSAEPLVNLFEGTRLAPEWRELVVAYPDRFILGFDNVFAGHWRALYVDQVALWRRALRALPERVARAVAHANAEALWRLPPAR